jgi:homoserine kinase
MLKTEIVVPCSTSNLGASFDTCGLALSLYLRVTVEEKSGGFEVVPSGEGAAQMPHDESNLIVKVANFVAHRRRRRLPGARLLVNNEIPLARGLGSSSCAIIAGISVYEALSGEQLSEEDFFGYAMHYEDHGDNLAPCRLGGLVVTCVVRNPPSDRGQTPLARRDQNHRSDSRFRDGDGKDARRVAEAPADHERDLQYPARRAASGRHQRRPL